jgi:hypothetical protein
MSRVKVYNAPGYNQPKFLTIAPLEASMSEPAVESEKPK